MSERTGFASLRRGGINFDSFPMRLFAKGNAKPGTRRRSTSARTRVTSRR